MPHPKEKNLSAGSPPEPALSPDAQAAIRRAEEIARGKLEPEPGAKAPGSEAPAPGHGAPGAVTLPAVPLGAVLVCLTDHAFNLGVGPGSEMSGALREQTAAAWDAVIHKYLPAVQTAGPLGALALCYAAHVGGLVASKGWTAPTKSSLPDAPAAGKPPG